MQSRKASALEACISIAIGLAVSMVANFIVFPRYNFTPTFSENVQITMIYTVISFARSYGVRRLFNWIGQLK